MMKINNINKFNKIYLELAQKIKNDAPLSWEGSRIQFYFETQGYSEFDFVKNCIAEFRVLTHFLSKNSFLNTEQQFKFNHLYDFLINSMQLNDAVEEILLSEIVL